MMPAPCHLGDGVYISFDGFQLWLAANDHRNPVIAIEPRVLAGIIEFAQLVNIGAGQQYFPVETKR